MEGKLTVKQFIEILEGFPRNWEVTFEDFEGNKFKFDMAHNPVPVCRIVISKTE